MNLDRPNHSTPSSASENETRNPPTKRAAVVGGVVGVCTGLGSHLLLLDYLVVSVTICLLYSIGVTLIIDYVSILREAPDDGGSWWTIAFGATIGLVLLVVQLVYRPVVTDKIAVERGVLPEEVLSLPSNHILVLWLLVFGVALVSLTYGIGMAVTDMSDA